jgi:hypothetical protein
MALAADVAGIDPVLGQRPGALGVPGQEQVAVVVEITDEGNGDALAVQLLTSSLPARARSRTWATVAATSAVSVLVIDWTTIGWAEPTGTPPIRTVGVWRRGVGGMRER